ncbi:MFS transporter [Novispirillum sp. DQ9]|uniref:MFS transporter n=1 Tax=Novispirillum sp. DQ9 TaxID=3398612 RepID=UPI003C7A65E5
MTPTVLLLALSQAALITTISMVLSTSALVGLELASADLATVPLAVQYLATMMLLAPAARLSERFGRRAVFAGGAAVGAVGLMIAALGIREGSFAVFVAAGFLIGAFNAVGQYYRFAAADAVAPERRSTAVSLTLAGGVLAAVAGPELAHLTRDLMLPSFTASFVALALIALLAAVLAAGLRLPPMTPADRAQPRRPLSEVMADRRILLAVIGGTAGYAVMNLLMTATPLAMRCNDFGFAQTAAVIQWHVVAMFAPSFVTGGLIRRLGVVWVMLLGYGLTLASAAVGAGGNGLPHFGIGLVLLGVGWNFLYVGATVLLAEACRPGEKAMLQALNDTLLFFCVAAVTLASGGLVDAFGWTVLNLAATVPIVGVAAVALLSSRRRASQPAG